MAFQSQGIGHSTDWKIDFVELDSSQNEIFEKCEGGETSADEADPLDNQSDIMTSSPLAPSSGVIPSPNIVLSSS